MTDKLFTVVSKPGVDAYGLPRKGFNRRTPMLRLPQILGMLKPQECEPGLLDEIEVGETINFEGISLRFEIERTA